jgi:pterin-4a-carbinolamine dehydratase
MKRGQVFSAYSPVPGLEETQSHLSIPVLHGVFRRESSFGSFGDVLRFMTEVGQFGEAANHHHRCENAYRTLRIRVSTWTWGTG